MIVCLRPIAAPQAEGKIEGDIEGNMLSTLARRYHQRLCQIGATTDISRLAYVTPAASFPWLVATLPSLALVTLLSNPAANAVFRFADPEVLRWLVIAGFVIPLLGMAYANITIFVCCCRAEMLRDR